MDEDPRVLVIDDDEALRELVIRAVKQAGYQVDAVGDGQAGLERLAERAYDVILSDVRMPGTGSRSTRRSAARIRRRPTASSW